MTIPATPPLAGEAVIPNGPGVPAGWTTYEYGDWTVSVPGNWKYIGKPDPCMDPANADSVSTVTAFYNGTINCPGLTSDQGPDTVIIQCVFGAAKVADEAPGFIAFLQQSGLFVKVARHQFYEALIEVYVNEPALASQIEGTIRPSAHQVCWGPP